MNPLHSLDLSHRGDGAHPTTASVIAHPHLLSYMNHHHHNNLPLTSSAYHSCADPQQPTVRLHRARQSSQSVHGLEGGSGHALATSQHHTQPQSGPLSFVCPPGYQHNTIIDSSIHNNNNNIGEYNMKAVTEKTYDCQLPSNPNLSTLFGSQTRSTTVDNSHGHPHSVNPIQQSQVQPSDVEVPFWHWFQCWNSQQQVLQQLAAFQPPVHLLSRPAHPPSASTCQSPPSVSESVLGGVMALSPVVTNNGSSGTHLSVTSNSDIGSQTDLSHLMFSKVPEKVDSTTEMEDCQRISVCDRAIQTELELRRQLSLPSPLRFESEQSNFLSPLPPGKVVEDVNGNGISNLYLATRLHEVGRLLEQVEMEMDAIAYEFGVQNNCLLPFTPHESSSTSTCFSSPTISSASSSSISMSSSSPSWSSMGTQLLSCGREIIDEAMLVSDEQRQVMEQMRQLQVECQHLKLKWRRCRRGEWLKEGALRYRDLLVARQKAKVLVKETEENAKVAASMFHQPSQHPLSLLSLVATEVEEGRRKAVEREFSQIDTKVANQSRRTLSRRGRVDPRKSTIGRNQLCSSSSTRQSAFFPCNSTVQHGEPDNTIGEHSSQQLQRQNEADDEGPPEKQLKLTSTSSLLPRPQLPPTPAILVSCMDDEDAASIRPPTPDLRRCDLDLSDLSSGQRILLAEGSYLRPGLILSTATSPFLGNGSPEIKAEPTTTSMPSNNSSTVTTSPISSTQQHWWVQLENDRRQRRCLPAYELLNEAVLEVRPSSVHHLPPGTRVCAHWSKQMADKLFPGTVVDDESLAAQRGSGDPAALVAIDFDDSDFRHVPLHQIRMLPEKFTKLTTASAQRNVITVDTAGEDGPLLPSLVHDRMSVSSASPIHNVRDGDVIKKSTFKKQKASNSPSPSKKALTNIASSRKSKKSGKSPSGTEETSECLTEGSLKSVSSSTRKKKKNVVWVPVGECIRSSRTSHLYQSAQRLVDKHTIRVGDSVQMIANEDGDEEEDDASTSTSAAAVPVFLGRVEEIRQDKALEHTSIEDAVKVKVRWYYAPQEAQLHFPQAASWLQRLPVGALFTSDHYDVNEARTIIRNVRIAKSWSQMQQQQQKQQHLLIDTKKGSADVEPHQDATPEETVTVSENDTCTPKKDVEKRKSSSGKRPTYFLAGSIRMTPKPVIHWDREMMQLMKATEATPNVE